ncbi:hypothetical protein [Flagellimonas sp.]|uniref:hypothetical protein n=1 Tax=Flagellimonas sp. TaxID=2058762 RepID=UPI003BAC9A45
MSKKEFLELLIKTFGLIPYKVKHYRTDSAGGQFQIKTGWEVIANDTEGNNVFTVETPEGFNDAVKEIIDECKEFQTVVVD